MWLWKADIDSAFRRIPIMPSQRSFAWVALRTDSGLVVAQHLSIPFGSSASGYHWDRIGTSIGYHVPHFCTPLRLLCTGALVTAIARRILHLPVLRFVDDYFAMDRGAVAKHSLTLFARWVLHRPGMHGPRRRIRADTACRNFGL